MREEILARFFEGRATGAELAQDLEGSEKRFSAVASLTRIEDMQREFTVTREMAITLCDAVLNGEVEPSGLATIGFALMASDKFSWNDEDILGEIIADWSCPEVNYPLTMENVKRFRAWLTGSEAYPVKSAKGEQGSRIVSVRYKNRRDPSQT